MKFLQELIEETQLTEGIMLVESAQHVIGQIAAAVNNDKPITDLATTLNSKLEDERAKLRFLAKFLGACQYLNKNALSKAEDKQQLIAAALINAQYHKNDINASNVDPNLKQNDPSTLAIAGLGDSDIAIAYTEKWHTALEAYFKEFNERKEKPHDYEASKMDMMKEINKYATELTALTGKLKQPDPAKLKKVGQEKPAAQTSDLAPAPATPPAAPAA